jgi:Protein of unknown function (DUF2630)
MRNEAPVMDAIRRLIDQEHVLRAEQSSDGGDAATLRHRVQEVEAELDQCWDLLRQRRAARVTGSDGDAALARAARDQERSPQ